MKLFLKFLGLILLLLTHQLLLAGPDRILAKKENYTLYQSELGRYQQILSFMIDQELTQAENEEIKEEVVQAFLQNPRQIKEECWALKETLNYLQMHTDAPAQEKVRSILFETLFEFEKKGGKNAFIRIIDRHGLREHLPKKHPQK